MKKLFLLFYNWAAKNYNFITYIIMKRVGCKQIEKEWAKSPMKETPRTLVALTSSLQWVPDQTMATWVNLSNFKCEKMVALFPHKRKIKKKRKQKILCRVYTSQHVACHDADSERDGNVRGDNCNGAKLWDVK